MCRLFTVRAPLSGMRTSIFSIFSAWIEFFDSNAKVASTVSIIGDPTGYFLIRQLVIVKRSPSSWRIFFGSQGAYVLIMP